MIKVSELMFNILSDVQTCPSKEFHKLDFIKHLIFRFEKDLSVEIDVNLEIELFKELYKKPF